ESFRRPERLCRQQGIRQYDAKGSLQVEEQFNSSHRVEAECLETRVDRQILLPLSQAKAVAQQVKNLLSNAVVAGHEGFPCNRAPVRIAVGRASTILLRSGVPPKRDVDY